MTDKEKTIINGVDVYIGGLASACSADDYSCDENPNCYFKQSARKDERVRELEQENRRLKYFYKHLTFQDEPLTASQHNTVIEIFKSIGADIYIDENRTLKQKLSQIKELAGKCKVLQCSKETCGYLDDSTDDIYGCIEEECEFYLLQQIKQIAQEE